MVDNMWVYWKGLHLCFVLHQYISMWSYLYIFISATTYVDDLHLAVSKVGSNVIFLLPIAIIIHFCILCVLGPLCKHYNSCGLRPTTLKFAPHFLFSIVDYHRLWLIGHANNQITSFPISRIERIHWIRFSKPIRLPQS